MNANSKNRRNAARPMTSSTVTRATSRVYRMTGYRLAPMADPDLLARARAIRDAAHGTRVTFSPKVFIPLTMLCRDKCGYCTFAQPPARLDSPYLSPEQVLQ